MSRTERPAFVIFCDSTQREIACACPQDLAALGQISGIGTGKLSRYGQAVLDCLDANASSTD